MGNLLPTINPKPFSLIFPKLTFSPS